MAAGRADFTAYEISASVQPQGLSPSPFLLKENPGDCIASIHITLLENSLYCPKQKPLSRPPYLTFKVNTKPQ